jgi:hypothetical protein
MPFHFLRRVLWLLLFMLAAASSHALTNEPFYK